MGGGVVEDTARDEQIEDSPGGFRVHTCCCGGRKDLRAVARAVEGVEYGSGSAAGQHDGSPRVQSDLYGRGVAPETA